jgi:dTDP-4-amino-4,6-dideoxygalactose transaminase
MQHMLDREIATRRGIMCIHRETAYADLPPRFPLPFSEDAQTGCILLPLFPQMTADMQAQVVEALRQAVQQ